MRSRDWAWGSRNGWEVETDEKVPIRNLPEIVQGKGRCRDRRSSTGRGRVRTSIIGVKEEWGVGRTEVAKKQKRFCLEAGAGFQRLAAGSAAAPPSGPLFHLHFPHAP